jgi:hypothetical protein
MDYSAGLDVSLERVSICIVIAARDVLLEKKVETEPQAIVAALKHTYVRGGAWRRTIRNHQQRALAVSRGAPR